MSNGPEDFAALMRGIREGSEEAARQLVERYGPRILWVGVGEGLQEVVKLHDDLEEPLLDMGCYRREERDYTPHLTLGRVKGDKVTFKLNELISKNQGWTGGQSTIREVLVMSSTLRADGPEYTVMARAKLGGGK